MVTENPSQRIVKFLDDLNKKNENNIKVTVVGLGYIGLPTAAVIASKNIKVFGYDINEKVVSKVNKRNSLLNLVLNLLFLIL